MLGPGGEHHVLDLDAGPGRARLVGVAGDRRRGFGGVARWSRRPFRAGDALLFDHLLLHRTAVGPGMTRERYAMETWLFAPSVVPRGSDSRGVVAGGETARVRRRARGRTRRARRRARCRSRSACESRRGPSTGAVRFMNTGGPRSHPNRAVSSAQNASKSSWNPTTSISAESLLRPLEPVAGELGRASAHHRSSRRRAATAS